MVTHVARPPFVVRTQTTVAEERAERAVKVRKITEVHPNWAGQGRGEFGAFVFQMILDDGAEEYLLHPVVEDAKVLRLVDPQGRTSRLRHGARGPHRQQSTAGRLGEAGLGEAGLGEAAS